jgi:hypothetical protein
MSLLFSQSYLFLCVKLSFTHEDVEEVEVRLQKCIYSVYIHLNGQLRAIYKDFCLSWESNADLLVLQSVAILTYEIYISIFCENTF